MKRLFISLLCILVFGATYSQNSGIEILRDINLNRNQSLDPFMRSLSQTTAAICVVVPVSLITYTFIKKDSTQKFNAITIGASVFTAASSVYLLKHIVNRTRPFVTYPDLDRAISVHSASFPSGHTSNSFSLATSLSLSYPKWYVIAPSYLWASSVAYSRMHLGVHYPGDVLAGAFIGAGSAFICYKLNKLLAKKYY
jgi:membrane-associated phospholipid phosphatase